jgi:O-antigen/teichoic acid export membrane protein
MSDLFHHLALRAKSRTGFGPGIVVCFLIALLSLVIAVGFLCAAAFVWLASRYDAVMAGLILAGVFLLIAILSVAAAHFTRRRNMERARLELAVRNQQSWLDPKYLSFGLEIGRAVGWRRIGMLAAAAVFAAGLGREWRSAKKPEPGEARTGD